eukprot:jgi/Chlat1/718/Chrsp104S01199
MFELLYGLWSLLFKKAEFHVLILGLDHAGKTTLLEKIKSSCTDSEGLPPDHVVPTVGLNIGRVEVRKAKLIFWDLGGQASLQTIWDKYFEEANAVLYVFDSTCPERFAEANGALNRALSSQALAGAPLLVLASKQDLQRATSPVDVAKVVNIDEISQHRLCAVRPASSFDGSGVMDAVEWLVEAMKVAPRSAVLRQKQESSVSNGRR